MLLNVDDGHDWARLKMGCRLFVVHSLPIAMSSVTRLGNFLKFLVTNFLAKVAQIGTG